MYKQTVYFHIDGDYESREMAFIPRKDETFKLDGKEYTVISVYYNTDEDSYYVYGEE